MNKILSNFLKFNNSKMTAMKGWIQDFILVQCPEYIEKCIYDCYCILQKMFNFNSPNNQSL